MRPRHRLDRIESLLDEPPNVGGGGAGLCIIRICGGLGDAGRFHATIVGGPRITSKAGETEKEFEDRVIDLAVEMRAAFVVIGGLPP